MASKDSAKIYRVTGDLIQDPTDATDPTSGTALGIFHYFVLRPNARYEAIPAHEYGGETVEIVEGGFDYVLGCLLRQWDADALSLIFPYTSTGAVSSDISIDHPGTTRREGALASSRACKLLLASDDSRHPSLYLPAAVPLIESSAELQISILNELTVPVLFHALRDTSGKSVYFRRLEDMP